MNPPTTEENPMSPTVRTIRTVVQVALAVLVAVPSAVNLLGLPADTTAKVVGIAGAAVVIVTAVQNAVEQRAGRSLGE